MQDLLSRKYEYFDNTGCIFSETVFMGMKYKVLFSSRANSNIVLVYADQA